MDGLNLPEVGNFSRFAVYRYNDVHSVSGTGLVAFGIRFPDLADGRVVYRWTTEPRTTQHADQMDDVRSIHGHGYDSVVAWLDEPDETIVDQYDVML